jgi:U4/U6 small nuclear ribonucleoprotein PRP31
MSTLVDELLQDFEDSGSESGGDGHDGDDGLGDEEGDALMGNGGSHMDMDPDDMGSEDEDEEMGGVERTDDPEEMKAKVDKMQLRGVDDIRTVATLMKTLEPVLEVSWFLPCSLLPALWNATHAT